MLSLTDEAVKHRFSKGRWMKYGFTLCRVNAAMSKDPSTKVGAVILRPDGTLLSSGWNGFPPGADDSPDLYENRNTKYSRIIHAEMNAILGATEKCTGCVLFTWPLPPCDRCAAHIAKAGISLVIAPSDYDPARWGESCSLARNVLMECGVSYVLSKPEFMEGFK